MKEKPNDLTLEYAGFWIRLAAALIDFGILIIGLYILYCVISQSFFWIFPDVGRIIKELHDVARGMPVPGTIIWLMSTVILMFLLCCTVYFVALWATTGQTLGKLSLGIKVIRTDSSPLDLRFAFIRFLGCLLCTATFGIGFMLIAFDSHKQGWHDKLADTYVVKLPVKVVIYNPSLARGGIG